MERDSHSTRIANWDAEPNVFVIASMGDPANIFFHSLAEIPDDSEKLLNFLRIVRIFLLLNRLGFGQLSCSGFNR